MIIFHIIIAVTSLSLAVLALTKPQQTLIRINYGMIATTIATGAVLVVEGHSLLHVCLAGSSYTAAAVAMNIAARRRLLAQETA